MISITPRATIDDEDVWSQAVKIGCRGRSEQLRICNSFHPLEGQGVDEIIKNKIIILRKTLKANSANNYYYNKELNLIINKRNNSWLFLRRQRSKWIFLFGTIAKY